MVLKLVSLMPSAADYLNNGGQHSRHRSRFVDDAGVLYHDHTDSFMTSVNRTDRPCLP